MAVTEEEYADCDCDSRAKPAEWRRGERVGWKGTQGGGERKGRKDHVRGKRR